MAIVPQSTGLVTNGVRYEVLVAEDAKFELAAIIDDGVHTATSFLVDKKELGSNFRLTSALAYFLSQARTIHGGVRLAQTSHTNFTLRHLILGLGAERLRRPGRGMISAFGNWKKQSLTKINKSCDSHSLSS